MRAQDLRRYPAPDLWPEIERRLDAGEEEPVPRRRAQRPSVFAAVSLLLGVFVWVLLRLVASFTAQPVPGAMGTGEVVRIPVDGPPQPLAVGEGAVWVVVGTSGHGRNYLWRVDVDTNEAVRLDGTKGALWPAVGEGYAWATACLATEDHPCGRTQVLKLDPDTGRTLASIPLPGYAQQIAAGLGSVWVSVDAGIIRIDPVSAEIVDTFRGRAFNFLRFAEGQLWVSSYGPPRVMEVDPQTGEVLRTVRIPDPCSVAVGEGSIWVATCGGLPERDKDTLTRIDPASGEITSVVDLDRYGHLFASEDAVWIASITDDGGTLQVRRIDPATGQPGPPFSVVVGEAEHVMQGIEPLTPFGAAYEGSVWMNNFGAGEILRIPIDKVG